MNVIKIINDTLTKTSECDQDKVRQKCIMTITKTSECDQDKVRQ